MTNLILGLMFVAFAWWLLRMEWRIVRWFLTPELLLIRAAWRGIAAVAAKIERGRGAQG